MTAQRTSLGMFFRPRENALIARLDERLSALMGVPEEHGEGLRVLHYPAGAESSPHFDFLRPTNEANRASVARNMPVAREICLWRAIHIPINVHG